MCGLVGIISPSNAAIAAGPILRLAAEQRGRDYTGIFVWDASHKGPPISQRTKGRPNDTDYPLLYGSGQLMLANLRAEPTTEALGPEVHSPEAYVQPYQEGKWVIVHNGTVANDKALCREYGLPVDDILIDSWVIAALLNKVNPAWDTSEVSSVINANIQGSYALLVAHMDHPMEIIAVTNFKPLYYGKSDHGNIVIASTPEAVTAGGVANRNGHLGRDVPAYAKPLPPYSAALFRPRDLVQVVAVGPRIASPRRVLAVCSGGLDSTVAAAYMKHEGYDVTLLHFKYKCRAEEREVYTVQQLAVEMGVDVMIVDLGTLFSAIIGASPLTNSSDKIAAGEAGAEFAHEWVPARNLVMLSIATAIAEAKGYDMLTLGTNLEEGGAYPDNEPEFLRLFSHLLPYSTGPNNLVALSNPVGSMMKHEIVKLGDQVRAPINSTWSCYNPGERHCGQCGPCYMRKKAFAMAGITDTMEYEDGQQK